MKSSDLSVIKSFVTRIVYKSRMKKPLSVYKAFDPEQLKAGQKVEMEHTNDPKMAEQIAMDHLDEARKWKNPKYYDMLKLMEELMKNGTTVEDVKRKMGLDSSVEKDMATQKEPTLAVVFDFFKKNPNPADSDFHAWAEQNGFNVHQAESLAYTLATKYVQGE